MDVRSIPRSRTTPQFNEDTLPDSLATDGIGYRHLHALGGRRHHRKGALPSINIPHAVRHESWVGQTHSWERMSGRLTSRPARARRWSAERSCLLTRRHCAADRSRSSPRDPPECRCAPCRCSAGRVRSACARRCS
ncbi:MAG: DUF488 family protein, partial [Guyparkeria sp.]